MRMEVPLRMTRSVGGRLVKAHRVGKRNGEHLVIGGSDTLKYVGQKDVVIGGESAQACEVVAAANQNLEWPDRPKGNERDEPFVLTDNAR